MTDPFIPRLLLLILSAVAAVRAQEPGVEYRRLALADGAELAYAVVLPDDFDADRPYPVLLALPPGRQDRAMVDAGIARYWGEPARRQGFVVVSPVAPDGELFHTGAERHLPALLRRVRIDFRVAGNRMHLAGASNGGRSAFRIAAQQPQEFGTLTVLPGYPVDDADRAALGRLAGMVVTMWVGGEDASWVSETEATAARLRELGIDVTATVLPGEEHVPASLDGGVPMARIAALHGQGARRPAGARGDVELALDDFHDAAAKADAGRYFGRLTEDGVFLGTDATERWSRDEFRAWGAPHFGGESAWVFVPQSRNVTVDERSGYAWFDEVLGSASYGACRGTGTLRRADGVWRIALYDLTVPVPNQLLGDVVEMIRDIEPGPASGRASGTTTVFVVRHAEKAAGGADPELTDAGRARADALASALRSIELDAVYATTYRRTQHTVQPAADAQGLTVVVLDAAATDELARRLLRDHRGRRVLVAGHSNTVPMLLSALGIARAPAIAEDQYDDLFEVSIDRSGGARLTHLHYGAAR